MDQVKNFFSLKNITLVSFPLWLAVYYTFVVNIPVLTELYSILSRLESVKIGFVLSIPLFLLAAFNFIFNLFCWPFLTKPFFMLLLVTSSMVSYAAYNYGIFIDYGMVENVFETDVSESFSYISLYSLSWVFLIGFVPAFILLRIKFNATAINLRFIFKKMASMFVSLLVIGVIAFFYYKDFISVGRNNSYLKKMIIPTQYVYSLSKYVTKTYFSKPIPYKEIGLDAQQSSSSLAQAAKKPTLFVFVLGETARAQNYELNGYSRPTNQYTRDLGVISFQDVHSCGTATAVSVPCMFSNLTRGSYDESVAMHQDNLLDILQRAKVDLLWKENDGGDKGVAQHIAKQTIDRDANNKFCNGSTCYDMALLDNFEKDADAMQGNRMLTLHLMGSHGPTYYLRYPPNHRKFVPDCPRSDIENCELSSIVNTYDNTILYTDYVLSQMIKKLKKLQSKYNTALLYVSDHGESLGEKGLYLHGVPYGLAPENQTKVPMIMWVSEGFKQQKKLDRSCMEKAAQHNSYSQDNIFHSVLGIMDIKSNTYQSRLDLFAQCRKH